MIAHITLKYTGPIPGMNMTKREWREKIVKPAFRRGGIHWHRRIRPQKFTARGGRKYGYGDRKGMGSNPDPYGFKASYSGRKLEAFGHTLPLVFTGHSMQLTEIRDVRLLGDASVKVVLHSPGFNRKNPHSKINMRDELTRISIDDQRSLVKLIDDRMGHQLGRIRRTKTVKK